MKSDSTKSTPEAVLRSYIDRLDPKGQKLVRSVRTAIRKRFPSANEVAYDYASHFVIGYSPTDRGIDSVVAIDARADSVRLYFNQATQLPDPKRILRGSGKQARYIEVEAAGQLTKPDVDALISAADDLASVPMPSERKGRLIIRPTAASKRSVPKPAT